MPTLYMHMHILWRHIKNLTLSTDAYYLKNNSCAKFHPDLIWNDEVLCFLKGCILSSQQEEQNNRSIFFLGRGGLRLQLELTLEVKKYLYKFFMWKFLMLKFKHFWKCTLEMYPQIPPDPTTVIQLSTQKTKLYPICRTIGLYRTSATCRRCWSAL